MVPLAVVPLAVVPLAVVPVGVVPVALVPLVVQNSRESPKTWRLSSRLLP